MSAFQLTGHAEATDTNTRVVLRLRTPGGDMPVSNASLKDVEATIDGARVDPVEVTVKPLMTGCEVKFTLPGDGAVRLSGSLALKNQDGSVWATVPLPEAIPPKR